MEEDKTKYNYTIAELRFLANEYWLKLGGKYPKYNTSYHLFVDFIEGKNPKFVIVRLIINFLKNLWPRK